VGPILLRRLMLGQPVGPEIASSIVDQLLPVPASKGRTPSG
jgi:hypothetical protein